MRGYWMWLVVSVLEGERKGGNVRVFIVLFFLCDQLLHAQLCTT
jgi:hypothetical protein